MIYLTNDHRTKKLNLKKVEKRVTAVAKSEGFFHKRLDFIFTDNVCISRLSGRFRSSPHPTDVLAFFYGDSLPLSPIGEVVISLDVAMEQARSRGSSLMDEVTLLCTHGIIHLTGQDDETLGSWKKMREREFTELMKVL